MGVGQTKQKFLTEGVNRYKKLVSPYAQIEEKYLKEQTHKPDCIKVETELLRKNVPSGSFTVLLDIKGDKKSSEGLAKLIDNIRVSGRYNGICFIIGGHSGVDDSLRKEVDFKLSISDMTFTHQFVRLLLSEQIYRAYSILNNLNYHK